MLERLVAQVKNYITPQTAEELQKTYELNVTDLALLCQHRAYLITEYTTDAGGTYRLTYDSETTELLGKFVCATSDYIHNNRKDGIERNLPARKLWRLLKSYHCENITIEGCTIPHYNGTFTLVKTPLMYDKSNGLHYYKS